MGSRKETSWERAHLKKLSGIYQGTMIGVLERQLLNINTVPQKRSLPRDMVSSY